MTQCSHLPGGLPACLLALGFTLMLASGLPAQQRYRVARPDAFRQDAGPRGKLLATIPAGVEVKGDSSRNGWVGVTLEGWVWGASVRRTNRDGHNVIVTAPRGENLRTSPNGGVMARLLAGFLLDEVSRKGVWVEARRTGWMAAQSLAPVGAAAPATPVAADSPAAVPLGAGGQNDDTSALDRAVVARPTQVAATPDGAPAGSLAPDTPVRILARSGDWVRVQLEGWVRESDLRPDRKSTRLNSSHSRASRMPSSA